MIAAPDGPSGAALGRVLVVDDSDTVRALISLNLELEGFAVDTAADGQEALDRIRGADPGQAPDVVTLDVVMPRLDGFATALALRGDPGTAGVKIAMVTGSAQRRDLARGLEIGVDAYVTKPFDPAALVRTVRALAGCPLLEG